MLQLGQLCMPAVVCFQEQRATARDRSSIMPTVVHSQLQITIQRAPRHTSKCLHHQRVLGHATHPPCRCNCIPAITKPPLPHANYTMQRAPAPCTPPTYVLQQTHHAGEPCDAHALPDPCTTSTASNTTHPPSLTPPHPCSHPHTPLTPISSRSGVQLKDKWRNLVKFRHLSQEDAQALQPKTSGPWYRRQALAATGGGSEG